MIEVFGVRFNDSTKIYYFLPNGNKPEKNDYVIVETERGQQFGIICTDRIAVDKNRISFELKNILKIADSDDINMNEKNIKDAELAIELAKKLAYIYKTRIELRQIGVRDKAKCVGGYGACGRKLCCSSFLTDLNSVSINMAKNQNLALNPQKINGVCGRLMCCLEYENELYNEYKKDLPKVGEVISNDSNKGKVVYVDLFKRMYKLELEDGKIVDVML